MNGLIQELRRRNMFRVAGLYVGIAWIIIEASATLLPVFSAPDWLFRGLVYAAFAGFPIAMVLTWVYQLTDQGLQRDENTQQSDVEPLIGGRSADFVVIGVLTVALAFSVYLNLQSDPPSPTQVPPLSLLIADFDNASADPLFENTLEQALAIGLEGAAFITTYPRDAARKMAKNIDAGQTLTAAAARLVATREGIDAVVSGTVAKSGDRYEIEVRVTNPQDGTARASRREKATTRADVLSALNDLTASLRKDLGDQSTSKGAAVAETFTTGSLEALSEYTIAQELARGGDDEAALTHYRRAVELDPDFGRAYSGWALSEFKLGRTEASEQTWNKTLALLEKMTEREKFRTLGVYYSTVSSNYAKAIDTYKALVEKFPADSAGHNNLAVAYFYQREFDKAMAQGQKVLAIYPKKALYHANLALYAMYAGDFDTATTLGERVLELNPAYYKAYLPAAVFAVMSQDYDGATRAYQQMRAAGPRGASLANIGEADLALYRGQAAQARTLLIDGIAADAERGDQRGVAGKSIALAQALYQLGDHDGTLDAINAALEARRAPAQIVPAAALLLALERQDEASALARELSRDLRPDNRAYAHLIDAQCAIMIDDTVAAYDSLQSALALADAWLVRFVLGIAYVNGGHFVEALSEFEACAARRGEATALFLDDVPTVRYLSQLPYWTGRAKEGLGLTDEANAAYRQFLALRLDTSTDPWSVDARARLGSD